MTMIGRICTTLVVLGVVIGAGIVCWLGAGKFDLAATRPDNLVERTLMPWVREASIGSKASDDPNPLRDDPSAVAEGAEHYRSSCVLCHGAPGVSVAEFARDLSPAGPGLWLADTQRRSDGELHWIIANGIRMTGMPAFGQTHSDDDLWEIVAFLRHLPDISADEQAILQQATAEQHHHGDDEAGEAVEAGEHSEEAGSSQR